MQSDRDHLTINDLPSELYKELIKFFQNKSELRNFALVSKAFNQAAQSNIRDMLIDYLSNCKEACKTININQLTQAIDSYLEKMHPKKIEQEKLAIFTALKILENEILAITHNPRRESEVAQLKIKEGELKPIFIRLYGLCGLINGQNIYRLIDDEAVIEQNSIILFNAINMRIKDDPAHMTILINMINDLLARDIIRVPQNLFQGETPKVELTADKELGLKLKMIAAFKENDTKVDESPEISLVQLLAMFRLSDKEKASFNDASLNLINQIKELSSSNQSPSSSPHKK